MTLLLLVLGLVLSALPAQAATRLVANGGSAAGDCTSTPCTMQRAMAVALCGDTVSLAGGTLTAPVTYTGAANMLELSANPPLSPVCTAGSPMTVTAATDGGVILDGQNVRNPCYVADVTYWYFSGFNCSRGSADVLILRRTVNAKVQRMCAWQSATDKAISVWGSRDLLIEDACAFGQAQETFMDYWGGEAVTVANNVYRRLWIRAESSTAGAGVCVQYNYTDVGWTTPSIAENVICVYGPKIPGTVALQAGTNLLRHSTVSPYFRFRGMIDYAYNSAQTSAVGLVYNGGYTGWDAADWLIHANSSGIAPWSVRWAVGDQESPQTSTLTRGLFIGSGSGFGTTPFVYTNVTERSSLTGSGFDYQGTSNTPRLCQEYINLTYTSASTTRLWPWRMDDRIKAAVASAQAQGISTASLLGSAGTGYAAGTVTSEIVNLFGPLPDACSRAAPNPAAPSNLRFTP